MKINFTHKRKVYQSLSSRSPALANISIDWFERKIFKNSIKKPKLWVRYVDDTFVIWQHGYEELNKFYELVKQMTSIKFTLEMENDRTLPFLDILVRLGNTGISTEVYRKPTHSGLYINRNSNHPDCIKRGIIKTLQACAKSICSDEQGFKKEIKNIVDDFIKNGYSKPCINKVLEEKSS